MRTVYCTISAKNYLPQVLALHESFREHMPDGEFRAFVVDGGPDDVPPGTGVSVLPRGDLGLTEREYLDLAAIYDVVEFSTAVKPLVFMALLEEFDNVVYLDPDMWLTSDLSELADLLEGVPVLLTPHFLNPIKPGSSYISEIHSLTVGIYNLGFCAFSRSALPFLRWWWSHLERECLIYPLLGIFVDQKWVDIGAQLFEARALKDPGYNVGPWNFNERRISAAEDGTLYVNAPKSPLKLMHFSGFDPQRPEAISSRLGFSLQEYVDLSALRRLAEQYAEAVLRGRETMAGTDVAYRFEYDRSGRRMTRRIRRAYRKALIAETPDLPSPFVDADQPQFREWRRRSTKSRVSDFLADASIAAKYVMPDELRRARQQFPELTSAVRQRLLREANVRR